MPWVVSLTSLKRMMMTMSDWQYRGSQSFSNVSGAVDISLILNQQVIVIDVASPQKKLSWNKAGDIIQIIDLALVPNFFSRLEVSDSFSYLGFNPTLFKFQINPENDYRIRFRPVNWLTTFSITIWEYTGQFPPAAGVSTSELLFLTL